MIEEIIYKTPDGFKLLLSDKRRWVLEEEGVGMSPLEYITERGPFQHGESYRDMFLRPRTIQYHIRSIHDSRISTWSARSLLLEYLRPNRVPGVPGTLTYIRQDGSKRAIDVFVQEGPDFVKQNDRWDMHAIDTIVRFLALDPTYYDPQQKSIVATGSGSLTFPASFAITFTTFGFSATITNNGTWLSYPYIVIKGPMSNTKIENLSTDESIEINYSILSGRYVYIDLSYGNKTVTLDDNTNLLYAVSSDSDLATFHLQPGTNIIEISGSGQDSNTQVIIYWYERYIGI